MMEEARDGVVSLPRESGSAEERMLKEDSEALDFRLTPLGYSLRQNAAQSIYETASCLKTASRSGGSGAWIVT
jgi:hypothetical protein